MNPRLCRVGEIVELFGRKFYCFVACTLEAIDPEILVSDYATIRPEPINLRPNTLELFEVTNLKEVNKWSSYESAYELQLLSDYVTAETIRGKTVQYANCTSYQILIIFTDGSYIYRRPERNYEDEEFLTVERLTIKHLVNAELLPPETLKDLEEHKKELIEYKNKLAEQFVYQQEQEQLQKLAAKHNVRIVKETLF
jgi:hypothetical protein